MNDRELLELAAKAAGLDLTYCPAWGCMAPKLYDEQGEYFDGNTCWRPHIDDADALRLAVKIDVVVAMYGAHVRIFTPYSEMLALEAKGQDPESATRRAIVRAAAEIGRRMQEGGAA